MKHYHRIIRIFVTLVVLVMTFTSTMNSQNYIKTETFLTSSGTKEMTEIQYYDGIGRPTLSSSNGIGTEGNYTYTLKCYDTKGRVSKEYLPVVGNTNSVELDESTVQTNGSCHYNNDLYPYANTAYDALDRPTTVYGAGQAWHSSNKHITKNYGTNIVGSVKRYSVTPLRWNGEYYPAGSLTMEETINEDGRKTQVFKDFLQRVVLERVPDDDTLNIYYIYNNKNQLTYILTPEYQERGYKELFAYEYRYDSHGRLEKSERPHCNVEQNYYDTDGRVIYRQDAMGVFWFYFYDTMGRQVIKGTCSNFNYHHYRNVSMQSGQDGLFGTGYVYSYPTTLTRAIPVEVLFYDDYQFLGKSMFTSSPYCSGLTKTNPANATGLQTGSIQRTSSGEYLLTAIYYDEKGRVADLRETLADGGIKTTETTYTFTDKPQTETSTIVKNGSSTVIVKLMTYHNYNDQLETISFAFNGSNPVTVASYDYDDFGRIQKIQRGGNAGNVSYDYNLRGWTTSIDGKGFKEWLHYTDGHGTPYYSGNISSQLWKVDNENFKRGYRFSYNGFGWMHRADYAEGDDQDSHQDRYSEYISEYRLGGSVRKIERFGKKSDGKYGKIDNLRLYYNGLQVDSVKEDALPLTYTGAFDFVSKTISTNGPQYTYYDDGSLRWDANKGVSKIEYDRNRFPRRVQFSNGNVTEYVYSPEGEKIKAVYYTAVPNISVGLGQTLTLNTSNTLTVDSVCYVGNLIFENGQLSKFLFEGGYATFANGQPVYHYYTKDHLGNNRAVVNQNGTIEQIVHYYPFGAVYSDAGTNDGLQRYKYNGKELDRMHGLNLYDYGARNYDPLLCRFTQIDPLCEKYYSMNPYAYCANNPENAVDYEGKRILFVNGYHNILFGPFNLGPVYGGEDYWATNFVINAQKFFDDFSYIDCRNFVDGSSLIGGDLSGKDRYYRGFDYAKNNFNNLTFNMVKGESLYMVTHSEGSAFGAGIADYLISKGINVSTIVHLSADEGDEFSTPQKPFTIQFGYKGDYITGNHYINGTDIQVIDKKFWSLSDQISYSHGQTNYRDVFDRIWEALYSTDYFNYNLFDLYSK